MVHHNKYTKNHRKHSSNKGTQRARYMKKGGATTPVQEDSGSVFKPVTDAISGVTTAMGDSFNSFKQFADSSSEKSKPSPMDISLTEGSNTESAEPASMESIQPPIQTTETMVDQDENKLDTQISELQEQITNLEVKVSELEDKNSELTDQLADYEELKNLLKKMMGSSTMDNDLGDDTEESSPFGAPMQGDDTEESSPFGAPMNEGDDTKESSPFGAPMNEGTSSFKPSAQESFDNQDGMSTSPPMSPRNMEQNTEQEDPNKMSL